MTSGETGGDYLMDGEVIASTFEGRLSTFKTEVAEAETHDQLADLYYTIDERVSLGECPTPFADAVHRRLVQSYARLMI